MYLQFFGDNIPIFKGIDFSIWWEAACGFLDTPILFPSGAESLRALLSADRNRFDVESSSIDTNKEDS